MCWISLWWLQPIPKIWVTPRRMKVAWNHRSEILVASLRRHFVFQSPSIQQMQKGKSGSSSMGPSNKCQSPPAPARWIPLVPNLPILRKQPPWQIMAIHPGAWLCFLILSFCTKRIQSEVLRLREPFSTAIYAENRWPGADTGLNVGRLWSIWYNWKCPSQ